MYTPTDTPTMYPAHSTLRCLLQSRPRQITSSQIINLSHVWLGGVPGGRETHTLGSLSLPLLKAYVVYCMYTTT